MSQPLDTSIVAVNAAAVVAFVDELLRMPSPASAAKLVLLLYGSEGRHWLWSDATARILHRIVGLNRAVLDLLARARGDNECPLPADGVLPARDFDLPDHVRDLMAASLPPVAVPDWSRFEPALAGSQAPLGGDESMVRYRSLLAEILGLGDPEIPA